jgi:hypothetical protein
MAWGAPHLDEKGSPRCGCELQSEGLRNSDSQLLGPPALKQKYVPDRIPKAKEQASKLINENIGNRSQDAYLLTEALRVVHNLYHYRPSTCASSRKCTAAKYICHSRR